MKQDITTQTDNAIPVPAKFTPGEYRLLRIFAEYMQKMFRHDDCLLDAPLRDHVIEQLFDDIDAASYAAANDAADLAERLTRRACWWNSLSKEISQFLATEGPDELDGLATVHGLDYGDELEARFGAEMRSPAAKRRAEEAQS